MLIEFLKPHTYKGVRQDVGAQVEASRQDGKLLVAIKKAKHVEPKSVPAAPPVIAKALLPIQTAAVTAETATNLAPDPEPSNADTGDEAAPSAPPEIADSLQPRRRAYRRRDLTPEPPAAA